MRRGALPCILSVLGVAILAGCDDALSTSGSTPSTPTVAPSGSVATTHASRAGSATSVPFSGRCDIQSEPFPSPLPPVLRQAATGTCQLAHLGQAAVFVLLDINFALGTQTSVAYDFTAANGDVLRSSVVGTNTPSGPGTARISATVKFTGGTGRFANATGEAHAEGVANFATRSSSVTYDGWIRYDPADRR